MAVVAKRGAGDKPGGQVIESILSTDELKAERGRQELNRSAPDRISENGGTLGTLFKRPGKIAQVSDDDGIFKAKIKTWALNISNVDEYSTTSSLQMERIKK